MNEPRDITDETYRTYYFPGRERITFQNPTSETIDAQGRTVTITDGEGKTFDINPNYLAFKRGYAQ